MAKDADYDRISPNIAARFYRKVVLYKHLPYSTFVLGLLLENLCIRIAET
jgi:hypothetical protein